MCARGRAAWWRIKRTPEQNDEQKGEVKLTTRSLKEELQTAVNYRYLQARGALLVLTQLAYQPGRPPKIFPFLKSLNHALHESRKDLFTFFGRVEVSLLFHLHGDQHSPFRALLKDQLK